MCCSEVCCLRSYVHVVCFSLQVARTKNVIGDPSYFMDKVKKVGQVNLRLKWDLVSPQREQLYFVIQCIYLCVVNLFISKPCFFEGVGGIPLTPKNSACSLTTLHLALYPYPQTNSVSPTPSQLKNLLYNSCTYFTVSQCRRHALLFFLLCRLSVAFAS